MLKFRASAFKNGIKESQINEVLADRWGMTRWFKIHDDIGGNSQDMAVGFDVDGAPIEIGVTYIEDDEIIFHADQLTPAWQNRYNED